MTFKFEVGEEVILYVKDSPELCGSCVVTERSHTMMQNTVTGNMLTSCFYRVDTTEQYDNWWIESALHKKHKPSDQSFEDMIAKINKGVAS